MNSIAWLIIALCVGGSIYLMRWHHLRVAEQRQRSLERHRSRARWRRWQRTQQRLNRSGSGATVTVEQAQSVYHSVKKRRSSRRR